MHTFTEQFNFVLEYIVLVVVDLVPHLSEEHRTELKECLFIAHIEEEEAHDAEDMSVDTDEEMPSPEERSGVRVQPCKPDLPAAPEAMNFAAPVGREQSPETEEEGRRDGVN